MRADLHSHTKNSDGKLTVLELINRAKKNNVDILAITDHDCFDGIDEAFRKYKDKINLIYGVELSTKRNKESVHVLGYFKKPLREGAFYDYLKDSILYRKNRANRICDLLEEHFNIVLDRGFITSNNSITRANIANEIIKQGFAIDRQSIFSKMIGSGNPCYIPSNKLATKDGIKMIKEAGGVAVLAHPCLLKVNNPEDIILEGAQGIEAIYPRGMERIEEFKLLAKKHNIFVTAGSDFHFVGDPSHGDVGQCYLEGDELKIAIKALGYEY